MLFKRIVIENFRNFNNVEVSLKNRNVFFGLNDVGKTNFLYAMRILLDYDVRRDDFKITDFHNSNDDNDIKITLEIDISDIDNEDTQKIIAKARDCLSSDVRSSLFIQAKSNKDDGRYYVEMSWGCSIERLMPISMQGQKSALDRIFDVNYIDAHTDLDKLFKRAVSMKTVLMRNQDDNTALKSKLVELNEQIESLSSITNFERSLLTEINKYDSNIRLRLSSKDIAIDPYKNIYPYLIRDDNNPYYVSGDGLRKITSYSLHRLIALKNSGTKITIFLIEEPENHLHKTTLLKLSQVLFKENEFPYLFLTTHSSELLAEMDKINLVRIASANTTYSHFYSVPENYKKVKKMLNSNLARALFYDRVLLVEGASEIVLFDAILTYKCNYRTKGLEILAVNGIAFKEYINVLIPLQIQTFIKTDNDIIDGRTAGLNRVKEYGAMVAGLNNDEIKKALFIAHTINMPTPLSSSSAYLSNTDLVELCKRENIYLSKVDLEGDLAEALGDILINRLNKDDLEQAVKYLKARKLYNIIELVGNLREEDLEIIFNNENFAVLGGFTNGVF